MRRSGLRGEIPGAQAGVTRRDSHLACLPHRFYPVPPLPNWWPRGLCSHELPAPEFSSGGPLLGTFPKQVPDPRVCVGTPQDSLPPGGAWRKPTATLLAEVINEDDLLQEGPGRRVQDAVHRPQEGGPGLVVETEDDAGRGQAVLRVLL